MFFEWFMTGMGIGVALTILICAAFGCFKSRS